MAISGPRLRSYPAIFEGQGHINKVIPVSECLKLFSTKFSTNIFGKCWDFRKILRFWEILRFLGNFEIFEKFLDFRKFFRFSENLEIFGWFWDLRNFFRFSEKNTLYVGRSFFSQFMSPHHSDQMFQRSQVSRVVLCMSKVKVLWVSLWVNEWVSDKVTYWAVLDS